MKATFDGSTILDIEYSAKEIKPHFCRATREMEFDCYLDGRYVGTANSHGEAAAKLDALVFDALTHGDTATAEELDGGSYCATCGNEGDCPDCSPVCATCGGEGCCPDCEPKAEPVSMGRLLDQATKTQVRIFDAYYAAVLNADDDRAAKARRMLKAAERRFQRRFWAKRRLIDFNSFASCLQVMA